MQVKINKIGPNYWYYPSMLTLSRKFWHPRAYKSLKKLLQTENLLNQNFIITLNGDKDFEVFRSIQKLKGRKVFLNKQQIEFIDQEKYVTEKVPNCQKIIFYDKKSVKSIKKGFIPFYDDNWFSQNFKGKKEIVWRTSGFQEK